MVGRIGNFEKGIEKNMKSVEIVVEGCWNCPFAYYEYDDFAVGVSTIDKCNLAFFLNLQDYFISVHNNIGLDPSIKEPPSWCPIKNKSHNISLKI